MATLRTSVLYNTTRLYVELETECRVQQLQYFKVELRDTTDNAHDNTHH